MSKRVIRVSVSVAVLCFGSNAWALSGPTAVPMGGAVDGTALGDVDGDGRLEVAVVARGLGDNLGTLSLHNPDGSARWTIAGEQRLGGFPAMGDFDGDGRDEVVFCAIHQAGMCHVIDGDGSQLFSMGPYYYPSMTTSGPTVTDANGDGIDDIIIHSYGGEIVVHLGGSGAQFWEYNAWNEHWEMLFGHGAVADLDGDGREEFLVAGYFAGGMLALDVQSGGLKWFVDGWDTHGGWAFANGPLVTDLDGDGKKEIVQTFAEDIVVAFDHAGQVIEQWDVAGANTNYMSVLAADVDGSGSRNLLLQGGDGVLRELGLNGQVSRTYDLGEPAWVAPSFIDMNQDAALEIVATSFENITIIDGETFSAIDQITVPGGGLSPTVVAGDMDFDGTQELFTGAWEFQELLGFGVEARSLRVWGALGGSAKHAGEARLGVDANSPVLQLTALVDEIEALIKSGVLSRRDERRFRRGILPRLKDAQEELLQGKPKDAIRKIARALRKMRRRVNYDTSLFEGKLAEVAVRIADQAVARADAMGARPRDLNRAYDDLNDAYANFANGAWMKAVRSARKAAKHVRNPKFSSNQCPEVMEEVYLVWECETIAIRDAMEAAGGLNKAIEELEKGIDEFAGPDLKKVIDQIKKSVEELGGGSNQFQLELVEVARSLARYYLDQATASGIVPSDKLGKAEDEYQDGLDEQAAGDGEEAAEKFKKAVDEAQP